MRAQGLRPIVLAGALAASCPALATVYFEVEPNNNKTAATAVTLAAGDAIQGNSTTPAAPDYFRIKTAPMPPGVYECVLLVTSGTAHTLMIRGLSQAGGVINGSSDVTVQASSPPGYVQWYSFGQEEELYFRVAGTTPADYVLTLSVSPLSVPYIGPFAAGDITITTAGQGHATDTDLWVYSDTLGPLAPLTDNGNDDELGQAYSQSRLVRNFAEGQYYVALSDRNLANNLPSPADDDFRDGPVLDFPGAVVNSSTTTGVDLQYSISDSSGLSLPILNTKADRYDINWFRFVVNPPEIMGACCFGPTCSVLTPSECLAQSGGYLGDGTDCFGNPCDVPGACCFMDGHCESLHEFDCLGAPGSSGWSQGIGCDPSPGGAGGCVLIDGSCAATPLSEADCVSTGGMYLGNGNPCYGGGSAFVVDGATADLDIGTDLGPEIPAIVHFVNNSGAGAAIKIGVTDPGDPALRDFGLFGRQIVFETTAPNGQFLLHLEIPFTGAELAAVSPSLDPLTDADLTYFNSGPGIWELSVDGNVNNSPNCGTPCGPRGLRFPPAGPPTGADYTLGDYGTLWDPGTQIGYVWGNVDHATDFAPGARPAPPTLVGDMNCDGTVDFADINPFVGYLLDFAAWRAAHPGCPTANGDINGDGTAPSFGDINGFVDLLVGP